jgi:hypothetical protein
VYKKAFSKSGFHYLPPVPLFIVRPLASEKGGEYLTDYSNWFVTMGDSDFH